MKRVGRGETVVVHNHDKRSTNMAQTTADLRELCRRALEYDIIMEFTEDGVNFVLHMTSKRRLQLLITLLEYEERNPDFSTFPCTDATARMVLALPLPIKKGRKTGKVHVLSTDRIILP